MKTPYRENALVCYKAIPSAKSKKNLLSLAKTKEKKNKILAKEAAKRLELEEIKEDRELDVLARSDKWVKFWMENVDEQLNQAILSGRKFEIEISDGDIDVFQRVIEHGGYHSKITYNGDCKYLFKISVPQNTHYWTAVFATICVMAAIWAWFGIQLLSPK